MRPRLWLDLSQLRWLLEVLVWLCFECDVQIEGRWEFYRRLTV